MYVSNDNDSTYSEYISSFNSDQLRILSSIIWFLHKQWPMVPVPDDVSYHNVMEDLFSCSCLDLEKQVRVTI